MPEKTEISNFITYKTSSPMGDLLSLLPSIRQLYRLTGRKGKIYQALNVVGYGIPGIPQPFQNSEGESIMMGKQTFDNLIPLLKAQEYIEDIVEFTGQQVDYDLDKIRFETFTNQNMGSLHRVTFYVFPEMACDLSEPFLNTFQGGAVFSGTCIINFTPRFRNHWVNYYFLKEYENKIVFAGLEKERIAFCEKWKLDIPLLETDNFYELAKAIHSCKLFMSNQTGFFQIAEGLKTPRLLETCPQLPHVIPMGKNGYDFYHQIPLEHYFKKLMQ